MTLRGVGDRALSVLAAIFTLRFLAALGYLVSIREGRLGAAGACLLLAEPFAFAAIPVALLLARGWTRDKARWALGTLGLAALALASWPARADTEANAFGLASRCADCEQVQDPVDSVRKDHYPACRFRDNSLGYRDVEPVLELKKGVRRVLLVGDSYVWGDGIPANEETLGYLLRADLEESAPGRFSVMSAAHPGLGLYGYGRFIDALSARYKPEVVVVGYLGDNDHEPFDAQFLLDRLPRARPVRNLLLNSGAVQRIHVAAIRNSAAIAADPALKGSFEALARSLAAKAVERRYRLVFLSYFPHRPLPAPIDQFDIPEELRYTGRASDLWYARDFHPKAKLNRILAKRLAARLVEKET